MPHLATQEVTRVRTPRKENHEVLGNGRNPLRLKKSKFTVHGRYCPYGSNSGFQRIRKCGSTREMS